MNAPRLWLLVFVLIGGMAACPTIQADDAGSEQPPAGLRDLVCDSGGVIWGIAPPNQNSGPYRFENGHWRSVTVAGLPEKSRPLCMTQRADGAAVCLWDEGDGRRAFSVHHDAESKVSGAITVPSTQTEYSQLPRLFADSKNNVWFTGTEPAICRFSPDGRAECLHLIQPEECRPYGFPFSGDTDSVHWDTVSAVEDEQGRIWFYTEGEVYYGGALDGALVFDGENFSSRKILLNGMPAQVGLLARKDAEHFWASAPQGLCVLDTATFTLERVPDQPEQIRAADAVLLRGEECYFVIDSLWRLRAGRWEKLIDHVDVTPFSRDRDGARLWVPAARGNYLGSVGNGLWFLPDLGPPTRLDWKKGFPLLSPTHLIPLADHDHWLALDNNGTTWVGNLDVLRGQTDETGNPRLRIARPQESLAIDRRRHFWGIFTENLSALGEWDGERWISHGLPPAMVPPKGYQTLMGVDGLQRVWLRAEWGPNHRLFIYDPARDRWQSYDAFEKALEAQVPLGPSAEPPDQQVPYYLARFGPNGQICCLAWQFKVAWFDGQQWRHWSREDIAGKESLLSMDGPPFFSAAGRLRVNMGTQTFEYAGEQGWKRAADHESGYADQDVRVAARRRPPVVPPGAVTQNPDSAAVDEKGVYWFTRQGNLFRFRDGLCAAVFQAGETQPFIDRRRLTDVSFDGRGNAFLRTEEPGEYVILAPPGPPPHTSITLLPAGSEVPADHVALALSSDAGLVEGKARCDWRLDGGAWQRVASEALPVSVIFEGLPGGEHHVEARSFDSALQTDAAPAVLTFEIRLDPYAQVVGYIAQLDDPDYSRRKLAIAALARQPEMALPALRAARVGADESHRWWIDAALQQIAASGRATPPKAEVTPPRTPRQSQVRE